jgi:taurine transport system permease protein
MSQMVNNPPPNAADARVPPAVPGQPPARRRWAHGADGAGYTMVSVVSIIVLIALWYTLTDATQTVPELDFPSIRESWDAVTTLGTTLSSDAAATAYRMVVSWAIGCALGIAVGLWMARSKLFYHVVNPWIEALRPAPIIALIPFTLVWFGLSDTGRIVLGVLAAFMTLVVTTATAARNVNPVAVRAARSLGASQGQVYRSIVLPAIFPQLVAALRVAAALCWGVIVAAEFLGAQSGIGELVLTASNSVNTPVVLVGTVCVTLEAFIFEALLRIVTSRLTRWVERQ